jgi:hypothetical protein
MMPTQERLKQLFDYDEGTGNLLWKMRPVSDFKNEAESKRWNTRFAGKVAGHLSGGYRLIRTDGRQYKAHRLIWLFHFGEIPKGCELDHINCVRSDNRFSNLRLATRTQNQQNIPTQANNSSGYKGISFDKKCGKWRAQIRCNGKNKHLGYFSTREAGAAAYATAALEAHGAFIHSSVIDTLPQPLQQAITAQQCQPITKPKRPLEQLSLSLEVQP